MSPPDPDIPGRGATLLRILRALRRLLGLRPIDIANAMEMKPGRTNILSPGTRASASTACTRSP